MGDWRNLETPTGKIVPVASFLPDGGPKAVFLLLPALGVKAKFYKHVAQGLAAEGITTILFEQRGHGKSPYRPNRGEHVGYSEYLNEDLPTAVNWVKEQFPSIPLFTGGHSLGAHMGNYLAADAPKDFAGLIHMACLFPYYGFFSKKEAFQVKVLCALIPPLTKILGYYPGNRLGFGAKEYRQVMLDWRAWALTGNYDFGSMPKIEEHMARYQGPLLSVSFEGDQLASEQSLRKSQDVMKSAAVTRVHLTAREQGKHLGHFDWARKPDGVVTTISDWISRCLT